MSYLLCFIHSFPTVKRSISTHSPVCLRGHVSVCLYLPACMCVCVCVHQTSHAVVMAKGAPYLPGNTPAPPTHFTCSCSHDQQVRHTPLLSLVGSSCLSHTLSCSSYLDHTYLNLSEIIEMCLELHKYSLINLLYNSVCICCPTPNDRMKKTKTS